MPENYTPTATDALRSWLVHAGFGLIRRSAALAALDAFDAALRGVQAEAPVAPSASSSDDLTSRVLDALHEAHHRPGLTMLELAEHIAAAALSEQDHSGDTPEEPLRGNLAEAAPEGGEQ